MIKNKGGRPTKMTQGTIKKLEEAFLRGLSDEEPAYMRISQSRHYTIIARKIHSFLTEKSY